MPATLLPSEMRPDGDASPALALVREPEGVGRPDSDISINGGGGGRRLSIYSPMAALEFVEEFDFLTRRAIDPNPFFAPQFVVPAMPRLDERQVKLMVLRDEVGASSRMRLLMPFSVERAGLISGQRVIRAWTHPFGPAGTIPVDADDPHGTLADFLNALTRPELDLPDVLVLPEQRVEGAMARTLLLVASALGLPVARVAASNRAALLKDAGAGDGAQLELSARRRRELRRQRRILEAEGELSLRVAREPGEVHEALEEFLHLEASGWKGRERSALIMDRFRSAFTREAVNAMAVADRTRIYTLRVGSRPIASLVTFVCGGEAMAWKSAYDEAYAAASPGAQLMEAVTRVMLADPDIRRADSCAAPDHFVMNRFWPGRIETATLVVGLVRGCEPRVEAAARSVETARRSRNFSRLMRMKLRRMLGGR